MADDPPRSEEDEFLGYLVARAGERFLHGFTERMAQEGLTVRQANILQAVHEQDGIAAARIARRLEVSPQAMVRQIDQLCRRGLISRDPDPGPGRPVGIHLTPEGRAVVQRARRLAGEYETQIMGHLTRSEREALARALHHALERA